MVKERVRVRVGVRVRVRVRVRIRIRIRVRVRIRVRIRVGHCFRDSHFTTDDPTNRCKPLNPQTGMTGSSRR